MHKFLLTALLVFQAMVCLSQADSVQFLIDKNGNFINNKDSAAIIRYVQSPTVDDKEYIVHDYYPNGKLKLVVHATKKDGTNYQGYCVEYYETGRKKSDEVYKDGMLLGPFTSYYPNGNLHIAGHFLENQALIVKQCRDINGNVLTSDGTGEVVEYDEDYNHIIDRGMVKNGIKEGKWTFFVKDTLKYALMFNQGVANSGVGFDSTGKEYPFNYLYEEAWFKNQLPILNYLRNKIDYTAEAKKNNVKGTVHLTFVITKEGELTDIKVIQGLGHGLDEEAVRAIKLTNKKWAPAKRYGIPIESTVRLGVNFGLKTLEATFKN